MLVFQLAGVSSLGWVGAFDAGSVEAGSGSRQVVADTDTSPTRLPQSVPANSVPQALVHDFRSRKILYQPSLTEHAFWYKTFSTSKS